MEETDLIPYYPNPVLIDRVIRNIQGGLMQKIEWLDVVFGRAQRIVKVVNGKRYYIPAIYVGGTKYRQSNDYLEVFPDANIGNFGFFWIQDPQTVKWIPKERGSIRYPFALIIWVDLRKVYPNQTSNRNTEVLKDEILKALNGGFWLRHGKIEVNQIYELAENVYRGFTIDEVDNQFLMHPFAGFRFEGEISVGQPCFE